MDPVFKERNVDIVVCLDATAGMKHCFDSLKESVRKLPFIIAEAITSYGDLIDSLRVKVIAFRDYCDDLVMEESPFFEFPYDQSDFESFLSWINAWGGGDSPNNGLEALYYAMKSDFVTERYDRQIIILFTNSDALPLGERSTFPSYPLDMVDEDGLVDFWTNCRYPKDPSIKLREKLKRLIIFAPSGSKYHELTSKLNRSVFCPVDDYDGFADIDIEGMIRSLFSFPTGHPI